MIITNSKVLFLFLLSCLAFSSVTSSVTCSSSGSTLTCDIATANKTLIQETFASAFVGNTDTKFKIVFQSSGGGGATVNISLPDRITELDATNDASSSVYIETYTVNSGVTKLVCQENRVVIQQRNFLAFFPNLQHFEANELGSVYFPIFTQNKKLIKIEVDDAQIEDVPSRFINDTIFGGLDKLEVLEWGYAGITGIKVGSFNGLSELTKLSLYGNSIQELESCTFEGLEKLDQLNLYQNMISSVHPNAFIGLNSITRLILSENPLMPLDAITVLKNLKNLFIISGSPMQVQPEIIQQLNNLEYFSLGEIIGFNCTCDTEWISKLSSFGIYVYTADSTCLSDGRKVKNPSLYTLCGTRSYQCFNKSIECVGENWNRVDTVDGCECVYPEESYSANQICNDINECEDSAICQGNCTNTPGSYKCSCLEGYYNENDTLCSDINECLLFNGNCTHNCSNAIGSYECSCLTGYQQQGFSDCVDINECLLTNGNCTHFCSNAIGSYECSCLPGYLKNTSTDCYLPDPCSTNNGGCHHNCTDGIYGHVCSCLEGFKVSPSNISHCDTDLDVGTGELNANSKASALFVLLFVCFLLLVTIIILFVCIMFVFLYFRIQIQQLKSTRTPNKLSLAEMDKNKQRKATVIENPNSVPDN